MRVRTVILVLAVAASAHAFLPTPPVSARLPPRMSAERRQPSGLRVSMRDGWRSRAAQKAKMTVAGVLAAVGALPVGAGASQSLGLVDGRGLVAAGGASLVAAAGGVAGGQTLSALDLTTADGRRVAFVGVPQGATVMAKAKATAPVAAKDEGAARLKVAVAGSAFLAVFFTANEVLGDKKKGGATDDFDEEEAKKPNPLFEEFDNCTALKAEELALTAWAGSIATPPGEGAQMHDKQKAAGLMARASGWYGKTFDAEGNCQALVMKLGPLKYNAPLGLGNCKFEEFGYRQRWSSVMRKSVSVRYNLTPNIVDYIRRKDEDTLMGVVVKGKDPLAYWYLKQIKK